MPVNTKKVKGRRDLNFKSFDEILADAERLVAAKQVTTLGNWSLDRLLAHLAMTFEGSIDGFEAKVPIPLRWILPLFKGAALRNKMSPGIMLPEKTIAVAFPNEGSSVAALERLKQAIARTRTERMEARQPAFGKMTHDEWVQLHLRHSEMHLSFVIPQD